MNRSSAFLRALKRIGLLLLLGTGLGYLVGEPVWGLTFALLALLSIWTWHLYRIHRWLALPDGEPPEAFGIWGMLFDNIYQLQRRGREAQGRLESRLEYLQDSLGSMRDAWLVIDPRGAIAWANDSAEDLLGIRFPDDRGRPLVNLLRLPGFSGYFLGGNYSEPLRLPPGQDNERCLQFEVSTFGAGDRLVFVRDVTEQYRLELMRQDFVGNVSHELRTPLTVIKGYIDTLLDLDDYSGASVVKAMRQMSEQVARMESLLTDLLWLSTIESVESLRKTEHVDFSQLLRELVAETRTAYPHRDINLQIDSADWVLGDARELHSAASNLLVNALKYSDDSDSVTIEWSQQRGHPVLSVRDEGVGIDSMHIPRLTERFYRVDRSRSQRTGGTGLGLAIVKHVALSHQAELEIYSTPGVGSCFSLTFPPSLESPGAAETVGA